MKSCARKILTSGSTKILWVKRNKFGVHLCNQMILGCHYHWLRKMFLFCLFVTFSTFECRPQFLKLSSIQLDVTSHSPMEPGLKICNQENEHEHRQQKRYVLNRNKWLQRQLSWTFRDPFHLIKRHIEYITIKKIIKKAFHTWSKPTAGHLTFIDITPEDRFSNKTGNIDILFAKYRHGDREPFDGFGGIIAHSGYPSEGIVHLDGSEPWSVDGRKGLDLRFVILHELGHALGLRHSEDQTAIMHPYYSEQLTNGFELTNDDIKGIQKLYGLEKT